MPVYARKANETPLDRLALHLVGDAYLYAGEQDAELLFSEGLPLVPEGWRHDFAVKYQSSSVQSLRNLLLGGSIDPAFIAARIVHLESILMRSSLASSVNWRVSYDRATSGLSRIKPSATLTEITWPEEAGRVPSLLGGAAPHATGRQLRQSLQVVSLLPSFETQVSDLKTGKVEVSDKVNESARRVLTLPDSIKHLQFYQPIDFSFELQLDIVTPYVGNVMDIYTSLKDNEESFLEAFKDKPRYLNAFNSRVSIGDAVAAACLAFVEGCNA